MNWSKHSEELAAGKLPSHSAFKPNRQAEAILFGFHRSPASILGRGDVQIPTWHAGCGTNPIAPQSTYPQLRPFGRRSFKQEGRRSNALVLYREAWNDLPCSIDFAIYFNVLARTPYFLSLRCLYQLPGQEVSCWQLRFSFGFKLTSIFHRTKCTLTGTPPRAGECCKPQLICRFEGGELQDGAVHER